MDVGSDIWTDTIATIGSLSGRIKEYIHVLLAFPISNNHTCVLYYFHQLVWCKMSTFVTLPFYKIPNLMGVYTIYNIQRQKFTAQQT